MGERVGDPGLCYRTALAKERIFEAMIERVEEMRVGVYARCELLYVAEEPLCEEMVAAGWRLLNTEQAVRALRKRQAMAMGVWN